MSDSDPIIFLPKNINFSSFVTQLASQSSIDDPKVTLQIMLKKFLNLKLSQGENSELDYKNLAREERSIFGRKDENEVGNLIN